MSITTEDKLILSIISPMPNFARAAASAEKKAQNTVVKHGSFAAAAAVAAIDSFDYEQ